MYASPYKCENDVIEELFEEIVVSLNNCKNGGTMNDKDERFGYVNKILKTFVHMQWEDVFIDQLYKFLFKQNTMNIII